MDNNGVALWRQISQTLASEIDEGVLSPGDRLPASADLASRFGVNRHTVLKAISHLQGEGLVRTERGGGIYVEKVIPYRMGARTRLEENLLEFSLAPSREILSVLDLRAPKKVAKALQIEPGDPTVLVTLVATADEIPVSLNQNYFPTARLPNIGSAFRELTESKEQNLATRAVLDAQGVTDFRRRSVRIRGRTPTQNEEQRLRMPPNEWVFEVEVTNVDADGIPIAYGVTSFCISRVEFTMEFDGE